MDRAYDSGTELEFVLDESLVAGLRLEAGDTVYDASLKGRLESFASGLESGLEPEAYTAFIREKIDGLHGGIESWQTGRVISLSDGICRVSGLSDVMAGEMLAVS